MISIHALLAESDEPDGTVTNTFFGISIHALLAESDTDLNSAYGALDDFYPRSPCGERL